MLVKIEMAIGLALVVKGALTPFKRKTSDPKEKVELIYDLFGLNKDDVLLTDIDGHFSAAYDSWLLPETGMAWTFNKKSC